MDLNIKSLDDERMNLILIIYSLESYDDDISN